MPDSQAIDAISPIDGGRFVPLFKACSGFNQTCFQCGHFDPKKADKYRCKAMGACPAVTLSPRLIEYVLARINPAGTRP